MPVSTARMSSRLRSWSVQVANAWGPELANAMRPEAPLGKPTPGQRRAPGQLRRSIKATTTRPSARGASFRLRAPVIQAATTDKGARAHIIRPRRAKVLRFYSQSAGRVVWARQVNHPGNPAQNWWGPGLQKVGSQTLRKAARRVRF